MARTFIVAPTEDGVWVLDQHSVAERLIYETLLSRIGAPEQQILLIPENLDVSNPDLRLALVDGLPFLTELGFALEPSGPTSYWVQAVPTWLGDARPADILAGVLATLAEPGARHRRMPLEAVVRERFYKTVACHTAIRAGQVLSDTEMRTLWERLRGIDLALADVHGRAGAVFISHGEIARRLGRSGLPGGR